MSGPETCGSGSAYYRHIWGVEEPRPLFEDLPSHIAGYFGVQHNTSSFLRQFATLPSQVLQSSAYTLPEYAPQERALSTIYAWRIVSSSYSCRGRLTSRGVLVKQR